MRIMVGLITYSETCEVKNCMDSEQIKAQRLIASIILLS